MQVTTSLNKIPDASRWEIEEFERLGFTWDYVIGGKFPADITQNRVQVRDIDKTAPPMEVSKYAQSYERGDHLPDPVFSRDMKLVDGATRVGAMLKLGKTETNYFRLRESYANAPLPIQKNFKSLGNALNNRNGRQMDKANIEAQILETHQEGNTHAATANILHIPESFVQSTLAREAGRKRAQRLGVKLDGLSVSHLRDLGAKRRLDDAVWAKVANLSRDAKLTVAERQDITQRLERLTSVPAMLELLEAETTANRERIRGFSTRPSRAGVVKRGAGSILAVENDPESAVVMDEKGAEDYLKVLYRVRTVVDKIIGFQNEVENIRENTVTPVPAPPFQFGR